jgi:hypothetical protein
MSIPACPLAPPHNVGEILQASLGMGLVYVEGTEAEDCPSKAYVSEEVTVAWNGRCEQPSRQHF